MLIMQKNFFSGYDEGYDKHNWMFVAYAVWKNTPQEVAIAKFFLNYNLMTSIIGCSQLMLFGKIPLKKWLFFY
jgi:hypothetical protein